MNVISTGLILKDIEGGDFKGAFKKVQKLTSSNVNVKVSDFLKILYTLNKRLKLKDKNEDIREVYGLADSCCTVLFSQENPKIFDTMCAVCQIHNFLLSVDLLLAQKLSLCYFKLKNENLIFKVETKQKDVVYNLIVEYTNLILKFPPDKLFGKDEKCAVYWIQHVFKLYELNDYNNLSKLFRVLSSLSYTAWKHKEFYTTFANRSYILLIDFFAKINTKVETSDNDYDSFFQYLGISIFNRSDSASPESIDLIIKCVNGFTRVTDNKYESLALLKTFLTFFRLKGDQVSIAFDRLNHLLDFKYSARSQAVISIICSLLRHTYGTFKENAAFQAKLSDAVKIFLSLARITQIEYYRRGSFDIVILFQTVHSLLANNENFNVCEVLKNSFGLMSSLFSSYFNNLKNDVYPELINNALTSMCQLMNVYHDRKLFLECGELASTVLKWFNEQIITLDEYKVKLIKHHILKYLTDSLGEIGRGVQVQMMIINLATMHKKLSEEAFGFWAKLKCMESSKIEKEQTVIDFVQKYEKTMEMKFNYQISKVDLEYFLMLEVKCYASYADVPKEVVEFAAEAVLKMKNRAYYTLALVHCVDIFTSKFPLPDTSKFEALLHQCLHNLKTSKNCCETNLLLGSIYYQLFRCELLHLQKKNECELINLDVKVEKSPVLFADQDNEMDNTSFTPAYTYLQYEAHVPLMEKLDRAYKHWAFALKIFQKNDKIMTTVLRQMEALALSYRLYKYSEKERSVWNLILEFGLKNESLEFQVLACAQLLLLFSLDMDSAQIKDIRSKLESNKDTVSPTVRNLFFLNLSKNAYHTNKIEESVNILKFFEVNVGMSNLVCWEHLIFSKICTCDHPEVLISTIRKVYFRLLNVIKNKLYGSYVQLCGFQCAILDTAILLGKLYLKEKNIRISLYYYKAQLEIAQRLGMPLRVSEFLTELGYTDMAVWKSADCGMKLKVIETILEYDEIESQVKEKLRPGSPKLMSKVRVIPHFLRSESCSYVCCTNVDYQALTLSVITLNILNSHSKSAKDAVQELIQIGFKVIQYLKNRVSSHMQLRDYLVRFYNVISGIHSLEGKYKHALLYNSKALNVIADAKTNIFIDSRDVFSLKNEIIWKKNYRRKPPEKENGRIQRDEVYASITPQQKFIPKSALSLKLPKNQVGSTPVARVKIPRLCFIDSPENTTKPQRSLKKKKNLTTIKPRPKKKPFEDSSDDEFEFVGKTNKVFNISNLFETSDEDASFFGCSLFSFDKKKERQMKFSDLFGKAEDTDSNQAGLFNQNDLHSKMSSLSLNKKKCADEKESSQKLIPTPKSEIANETPRRKPDDKSIRKPKNVQSSKTLISQTSNETTKIVGSIQKPLIEVTNCSDDEELFTRRVRKLKPKIKVLEISSSEETPIVAWPASMSKKDLLKFPSPKSPIEISESDTDKSIIDETPPEKTKFKTKIPIMFPHDSKNAAALLKNPKLPKQPLETPTGRITRLTAKKQLRL